MAEGQGGFIISGDIGKRRGGEGRLTKKRMIHVSMTVRLAGRMENQDMEGGVKWVGWVADGYSDGTGGFYRMVVVRLWKCLLGGSRGEFLGVWSLLVRFNWRLASGLTYTCVYFIRGCLRTPKKK